MKTTSKALLAAMTVLSLGLAGLAQAQTAIPPQTTQATEPAAAVVQADYDEDDDGWFGFFGGKHDKGAHGRHGAQGRENRPDDRQGDQEARGDDNDDEGGNGCRQAATDANGHCQMGQNAAPPANGLFNGGAAPKAQVN